MATRQPIILLHHRQVAQQFVRRHKGRGISDISHLNSSWAISVSPGRQSFAPLLQYLPAEPARNAAAKNATSPSVSCDNRSFVPPRPKLAGFFDSRGWLHHAAAR